MSKRDKFDLECTGRALAFQDEAVAAILACRRGLNETRGKIEEGVHRGELILKITYDFEVIKGSKRNVKQYGPSKAWEPYNVINLLLRFLAKRDIKESAFWSWAWAYGSNQQDEASRTSKQLHDLISSKLRPTNAKRYARPYKTLQSAAAIRGRTMKVEVVNLESK